MSYLDYLLSGLGAVAMALCLYLGFKPRGPSKATALSIDIGLLAAIVTFIALIVGQHSHRLP
jgi:hypothetical protein